MVLLLNLLIPIAFILIAFCIYKRKYKTFVVIVAVLFVYMAALPSYMPKGEVKRTEVPAFEKSDAVVQDRLSRPESMEEKNRKREESYEKGLTFLK